MAQLTMLATCASLVVSPAEAQDAGWAQALDPLAREKHLAEGCATILESFGGPPMARVQGQRLYARARADVDGLVALLEADLAGERSPTEIPALRQRLEAVLRQRQALCRHVDAAIGPEVRAQGEDRRVLDLLAEGTDEAGHALIDGAVQLWQAYRRAGRAERSTILATIEDVRWRDYGELAPK